MIFCNMTELFVAKLLKANDDEKDSIIGISNVVITLGVSGAYDEAVHYQ